MALDAGNPGAGCRPQIHAERFYLTRAPRSWVPEFARSRGLDDATIRDWRLRYAAAGWTASTDHLRMLGHSDEEIQAAG